MTSQPVVHVDAIRKAYGKTVAVDGVSFDVQAGEIFGLIGPNGAGKTTTMECVEGLRTPDRRRDLGAGAGSRTATSTRCRSGSACSCRRRSSRSASRCGKRSACGRRSTASRSTATGCIEQLGLGDKRNAWFMTLSGGQKQRLFIALALINDPEVVFLDELTTGLDPQARRAIWDLVRGIRDRGKTVFLTTHLMEEAERLCDRVAIIDHGRIIDIGSPAGAGAAALPRAERHRRHRGRHGRATAFEAMPQVDSVSSEGPRFTIRGRGDDLVTHVIQCLARASDPRHRLPHRAADTRGRVPEAHRSHDSRLRLLKPCCADSGN